MKRILNILKQDMLLSFRDSLALYSLISPILLAVILRLVIPSVENPVPLFAVHDSVPDTTVSALKEYGTVQLFSSTEQFNRRIMQNDNIAGITYGENGYTVVLEGNEGGELEEAVTAVVRRAARLIESPQFATDRRPAVQSPVLSYGAVMIVMLSLFVGGILVGFNIVEEKESAAIKALAVTPIRLSEYISARSILALLIAFTAGLVSAVVMLGTELNWLYLAIAIGASLFTALPFGFIIGGFADSQMTAFALVKLLMAVYLTIPLVSIFVPSGLQWLFYLLPNYWMLQSLSAALLGESTAGFLLSTLLAAGTGTVLILLLVPKLKKGLSLR